MGRRRKLPGSLPPDDSPAPPAKKRKRAPPPAASPAPPAQKRKRAPPPAASPAPPAQKRKRGRPALPGRQAAEHKRVREAAYRAKNRAAINAKCRESMARYRAGLTPEQRIEYKAQAVKNTQKWAAKKKGNTEDDEDEEAGLEEEEEEEEEAEEEEEDEKEDELANRKPVAKKRTLTARKQPKASGRSRKRKRPQEEEEDELEDEPEDPPQPAAPPSAPSTTTQLARLMKDVVPRKPKQQQRQHISDEEDDDDEGAPLYPGFTHPCQFLPSDEDEDNGTPSPPQRQRPCPATRSLSPLTSLSGPRTPLFLPDPENIDAPIRSLTAIDAASSDEDEDDRPLLSLETTIQDLMEREILQATDEEQALIQMEWDHRMLRHKQEQREQRDREEADHEQCGVESEADWEEMVVEFEQDEEMFWAGEIPIESIEEERNRVQHQALDDQLQQDRQDVKDSLLQAAEAVGAEPINVDSDPGDANHAKGGGTAEVPSDVPRRPLLSGIGARFAAVKLRMAQAREAVQNGGAAKK
ncbi:hypothetical protein C8F01DRAFT_1263650 [Mycena amicta]|nr:hypothetical protein C8F01DRAFT_1263650 [Mycena amicta]